MIVWETKHGDMIARHDQLLDVLYEAASVLLLPLSERSVISYQVLQLTQVTSSYVAGQMEKMLPSM